MELLPYSFNGYLINDWWWNNQTGEWSSGFPLGQRGQLQSTPIYSEIAYAFPKLSTTQLQGHSITVAFHPKSTVNHNTIAYMREQLKGWTNIDDPQPHQFIAQDIQNGNKQWYLTAIPVNFTEVDQGEFTVTFALDDPVWRLVTASTGGGTVTVSPTTYNLTVIGNVPAQPIFTMTPNNPRVGAGFGYKTWVPVYNSTARAFPFYHSSIDITNGGLDTHALFLAGHMQASGADCRLSVDGSLSDFWFGGGGINTTTTKIWANIPHSAGQVGVLLANLPNNGTAVNVTFTQDAANLAVLKFLKSGGNRCIIIDSEAFTYTYANVDLQNYQIKSCTRASKTSAFAAHTAGASIIWQQHDVWFYYGNAAATAQAVNANKKPMIKLDTSSNTVWQWTNPIDFTGTHPARWLPVVVSSLTNGYAKQNLTNIYTGDAGALVNPATEMGMQMQTTTKNGIQKAETANLYWLFYHPAGGTNTSMLGKKYLHFGTSWPAIAGLYKSDDNINYASVWNEAVPALNTPTTFTHNAVTLSGTFHFLRLIFSGSIGAKALNSAYLQGDTISVTLGSGTLTASLAAEQPNYKVDATIKNNTSGESIFVDGVMGTGQTLTIDCGARTAVLDDGTNFFGSITFSPGRIDTNWLNIGQDSNNKFTGTAAIVITEPGVVSETWGISWKDSSL